MVKPYLRYHFFNLCEQINENSSKPIFMTNNRVCISHFIFVLGPPQRRFGYQTRFPRNRLALILLKTLARHYTFRIPPISRERKGYPNAATDVQPNIYSPSRGAKFLAKPTIFSDTVIAENIIQTHTIQKESLRNVLRNPFYGDDVCQASSSRGKGSIAAKQIC